MDLRHVLFVGGDARKMASVKIRCVDVAKRLGCDYHLCARRAHQVPEGYNVFVCVKAELPPSEYTALARRGKIIWDIIDVPPPREPITAYLASNSLTQELFEDYGHVEVIPHYHCNFTGRPNPPNLRRPVWLGARHWRPHLSGFDYDAYAVEGLRRAEVVRIFRRTGIGLNLRIPRTQYHAPRRFAKITDPARRAQALRDFFEFHLAVNSGIKLINCLGFGVPSVSSDEPAYREFAPDCTLFSTLKNCAKNVRALQEDDALYRELRKKCLKRAGDFHVDTIARRYKLFLQTL
jgi:hypothetical protein